MKKLICIAFLLFALSNVKGQVMMLFSSDSLTGITSPLGIDSLFYWFAADQGVLDSLGGAIANNEGVGTWQDLSGNGRHLYSNIDARRRPTYKSSSGPGGKPALVFKDDSTCIYTTDSSYWQADNYSMFFVAKANSTSDFSRWIAYRFNDAWSFRQWIMLLGEAFGSGNQNDLFAYVYNSGGTEKIYQTNTNPVTTGFRLYYTEVIGSSSFEAFYADGSSVTVSSSNFDGSIRNGRADLSMGHPTLQIADITVSEFVIFSKNLSATERAAIETYLNKKYDLY